MSHRIRFVSLFLACLLLATHAVAQTVYVTDKLQLGLYGDPNGSGQALRVLPSGTRLEVLQRGRNYARVRTAEGGEGWAKTAFLVEEKPARAQLAELETQNQTLSHDSAALREALSTAHRRVADLEERAATSAALAGESRRRLEVLQQENQDVRKRLITHRYAVPLPWLIGAAGASLLLGTAGGVWWVDYRIRRRHGGFRIY